MNVSQKRTSSNFGAKQRTCLTPTPEDGDSTFPLTSVNLYQTKRRRIPENGGVRCYIIKWVVNKVNLMKVVRNCDQTLPWYFHVIPYFNNWCN